MSLPLHISPTDLDGMYVYTVYPPIVSAETILFCHSTYRGGNYSRPGRKLFKGGNYSRAETTLASGIDVGQGINIGPGKFGKKNLHISIET